MIQYLYLGRVDYAEALRLQQELVTLRTAGRIGNALLLLEHPPVLTLGRNARRANILASDELLAARGVTLHEINRGGDVTYHGPGQLIGYPIFDLRSLRNPQSSRPGAAGDSSAAAGRRLGPVDFVRLMEEALIHLCGEFGVNAGRICGLTGVWCGLSEPQISSGELKCEAKNSSNALQSSGPWAAQAPPAAQDMSKGLVPGGRKIAAIGIHVARGVTSHGFAFNVTTDLRDFALINPCGITDRPVTSLEREVADPKNLPTLESLAPMAARQFGLVFDEPVVCVEDLASLRALADARLDSPAANSPAGEFPAPGFPAREFPAEDAPLQIPPEIERLRRSKGRPISA
jgi:lipoyl(octanoyl) transferase